MRDRLLILLAKRPDPNLPEQIVRGAEPRAEYLELQKATGAELVDFHAVEASGSRIVRQALQCGGHLWGLAALGMLRRNQFDDLYATGEDIGIRLAVL